MSGKYPFIPEYLTAALEDISIPLIDIMHGHLKSEIMDCEEEIVLIEAGDTRAHSANYLYGYLEALTDLYSMTYNLSIDRKHIEEKMA